MKGNEVVAQAAINAGCEAFFGYPITPQSEVVEYMSANFPEAGGVYVQSESEVAVINMVYGAAACGKRVMTSSSSPGVALMQEGISYMAGARLPAVIVSISRGGPGLGGILPSQSDYTQATRGGGNGDYHCPVFAPNSIQEINDLVHKAFNVAEKYRTPTMILMDGLLGQMMEPVELRSFPAERPDNSSWAAGKGDNKVKRNIVNSMFLAASSLEANNIVLQETYEEIKKNEVMYEKNVADDDELVVVAYGTASRVALNAIEMLKEKGIKAGLIRPISLWPFPDEAFELPESVKAILVVELSMGQMVNDVKLAVNGKLPVYFAGKVGGIVIEPAEVVEKALAIKEVGK